MSPLRNADYRLSSPHELSAVGEDCRLSDREESTAENRQLLEQGSAPIIRALMISDLMIGAQQCHPQV
ncbi:unnamed protein product, partial [Staurois parvus]